MAGENLAAGLATVRVLNERGIKGTLNYVGTHILDEAEARAAADEVIRALETIAAQRLDSNLSLKLTQIGLDIDISLCRAHLHRILECACRLGNFVRIDMEKSSYVGKTLQLFDEVKNEYGVDRVGIVIQSYLREHNRDLEKLVSVGARVRLVKGGYWEPDSVVYRKKAEIDSAFVRDAELLLARGSHPALASHDPDFITAAKRIANNLGRDKSDYEFQMLYGVGTDLQQSLTREGYIVRCYVPYGEHWYSYFLGCMRRQLEAIPLLGGAGVSQISNALSITRDKSC